MKISNEVKQRIYHVISITLLATILTSIENVLYDFQVNDFLIFAITVISMVVLYIVNHHRRIFFAILFSILVVIGAFLYIKKIPILLHIQNLWSFIVNYMNGKEELHGDYAIILIVLIQMFDCLIATVICRQRIVTYCSFVGTFIAIIVMSLLGFSCTRMLVAYVVLANLIQLVEICCNQMEEAKEKTQLATLHLLPVCFAITLCVFLLPMREDPIRWTGVRKAISMIREKGEIVGEQIRLYFAGKDGSYEMSFAGYSDDDSNLGGEVGSNEGVALKLKASTIDYPSYLMGNVKNIYTGTNWTTKTTNVADDSSEYINDLYEFVCALSRYSVEDIEPKSLVQYENFEIVYEDIRTITKFYPLKTYRFVESSGYKDKTDHYANLRFKKLKGEGTNYLTYFYRYNLDSEFLKKMLRDSDTFTYDGYDIDLDTLKSLGEDFFKQGIRWKTFDSKYIEVLQSRRNRIYKDYLSLPKSLPDRVARLARKLTQGLTTNYDKMKAIERYLNSFTYTTKTIQPEEGKDFVDSFLFEQKEGYCTYFASAMAVMGRCLGIPTRYVEGFYVDYEDKDGFYYTVKNSDAHAWVEVYFDGIGWIPFEPTPGYVERFYKEWSPISKGENNSYQSTNPYMGQNYQPPEISNPKQEIDRLEVEKSGRKINTDIVFIIVGVLGIILLLSLIYYLWSKNKMHRLYKGADNATKAVVNYRKIMYHLDKIGLPYSNTETLQVYTTRLDQSISIPPYSLKEVNDLYMAVRYGDYTITDEELAVILSYEKAFYEYLKKTYGRMKVRRNQWKLSITYKKLYS